MKKSKIPIAKVAPKKKAPKKRQPKEPRREFSVTEIDEEEGWSFTSFY